MTNTTAPVCASCTFPASPVRTGAVLPYTYDGDTLLFCDDCVNAWHAEWNGTRYTLPTCAADMGDVHHLPIPA